MLPKRRKPTLHIKTNHTASTVDGWKLHLVRTQNKADDGGRNFPVILLPGLGSSGAYTFDLSPEISLADHLADKNFDVWTIELRGNGRSDKPNIFSKRGRWWSIDDMCEKDVPSCMDHICMHTGCSMVHVVGHSMGGMILTALLAKGGPTAGRIRSATIVGSSCFLEGSWWSAALPIMPASKFLYSVPAGMSLRLYSNLAFSRMAIRMIDVLYFWPSNVDPGLAKIVLSRNFSAISPGVITQFSSAFGKEGLRSAKAPYAPFCDPEKMKHIHTPVMMICGDRDKMCPPQGAEKQFAMLTGSNMKKLIILGPPTTSTHVGHFDVLMGKRAQAEVFPKITDWLCEQDQLEPLTTVMQATDTVDLSAATSRANADSTACVAATGFPSSGSTARSTAAGGMQGGNPGAANVVALQPAAANECMGAEYIRVLEQRQPPSCSPQSLTQCDPVHITYHAYSGDSFDAHTAVSAEFAASAVFCSALPLYSRL